MATGSRKTWLEKQPDEVQVFVLSMESEGRTLDHQVLSIKERFGKRVVKSTLQHSLSRYHATVEKEFLESKINSRELSRLLKEHPDIDPEVLMRGYFASQLGSTQFRVAHIKPKDLLLAMHREQKLSLEERRIRAIEEGNRLKRHALTLVEQRLQMLKETYVKAREGLRGVLASEEADPKETLRKIREVYGLFDEPGESNPVAALPGKVDSG